MAIGVATTFPSLLIRNEIQQATMTTTTTTAAMPEDVPTCGQKRFRRGECALLANAKRQAVARPAEDDQEATIDKQLDPMEEDTQAMWRLGEKSRVDSHEQFNPEKLALFDWSDHEENTAEAAEVAFVRRGTKIFDDEDERETDENGEAGAASALMAEKHIKRKRLRGNKKDLQPCIFCDPEKLKEVHKMKNRAVTEALLKLLRYKTERLEPSFAFIMEHLGEEAEKDYRKRVDRADREAHRRANPKLSIEEQWKEALENRNVAAPIPTETTKSDYKDWIRDDVRMRDQKFAEVFEEGVDKEAWMTPLARSFEQWATYGSWAMCKKCHTLEKRPFLPADVTRPKIRKAWIEKCKHCRKGIGYAATQWEDIPVPLRNLPEEVLHALRPMDVDIGVYRRGNFGYREHTDMIRFRWKPKAVDEAISDLSEKHFGIAMEAWDYLMSQGGDVRFRGIEDMQKYYMKHPKLSAYKAFASMHNLFLARNRADLTKEKARLPARFIETLGLETAVWPHLYPTVKMCETYVRRQDGRRLLRDPANRRQQREKQGEDSDDSDSDDDDDEDDDEDNDDSGRQSLKASFLAKLFSPVVGYGSDAALAQFVYDLWMWSGLGGAKHASGVKLRVALRGKTFSPEYWKTKHASLIDMQKQIGYPTLFLTIAPFEWSAPYHKWMEKELRQTFRSRLYLPGAESFHLAHLLTQAVVGLVTGANKQKVQGGRADRMWTKHIFSAKDGSGRNPVVNYYGRLEFQDGKRKRGNPNQRQDYHKGPGSGRPHVHFLVWLDDPAVVKLPGVICATIPDENAPLRRIVLSSQQSWTESGWPQRDKPSEFDVRTGLLHLQHKQRDYEKGIRAYMPDISGALKCHMDVQASDGRGLLLRYVAGYVPKFSDAFAQEWLNDEASDYAVARRILTEYHPMEPEMWLQLGGHLFPQAFAGGTLKRIVVPVPWRDEHTVEMQSYMSSTWRREGMTFLEYLRKANKHGQILQYLTRKFKQDETDSTLEEWANSYSTKGEVVVAVTMCSRFSDTYYKQWLIMNVPYRSIDQDLWKPAAEKVPENFRGMALCLLQAPSFWRNTMKVRADLELEAHKDPFIESNIAMLEAHIAIVDSYLSGELILGRDAIPQRRAELPEGPVPLDSLQWSIVDAIRQRVESALRLAWPDDWFDDQPRKAASDTMLQQPFVVLGPAGSGKSSAVKKAIQDASGANARVIVACPTRMLVATWKQDFPDLDVDSVHAAFRIFHPEQETLDAMVNFDLVVVEEVGTISQTVFDRLLRLWDAADRRPALVFVGDFAQLRGMEPTRAFHSERWPEMKKFTLREMRRCKDPALKWKLELLREYKPSIDQLKAIKKGRKAPYIQHRTGFRMNEEPTEEEIAWIFHETPNTMFVTISKAGAAWVNQAAVKFFFAGQEPLLYVDGDPAANPENFDGSKQIADIPMRFPIYKNMRLQCTQNMNKDTDYVNGMGITVLGANAKGILAVTDTGYTIGIYRFTDEWHTVYMPVRMGYANTLIKMQGATLKHLTIYLDVKGIEAAGYVALSRVQHDKDWRFVGDPQPEHFIPASMV